jgi:hypothetical protein
MPLALALVDDEIFAPQLSTHNPICPPTEVGGYGSELEKLFIIRHSLSFWALACFDFIAAHLGWVVKAVHHSPLATR